MKESGVEVVFDLEECQQHACILLNLRLSHAQRSLLIRTLLALLGAPGVGYTIRQRSRTVSSCILLKDEYYVAELQNSDSIMLDASTMRNKRNV